MVWVNGKLSDVIAVNDRSFLYGDGGFTTMLTQNGAIQFWPLHQERMQTCLQTLAITEPDWTQVLDWLRIAALPDEQAGLKLQITRGGGGRGYSPAGISQPNVIISHFGYPSHYLALQQQGISLGICQRRLGINPMLAGHKHNNRLEQVLLKAEMDQSGHVDGIVLDIHGRVIETTMANLFWVRDRQLYTPKLESAGVAGVARRLVIEHAPQLGLTVQIGEFGLEDVQQATEIFITNSILGVAPVTQIGERSYSIGEETRRYQQSWSQGLFTQK